MLLFSKFDDPKILGCPQGYLSAEGCHADEESTAEEKYIHG